MKSDRGMKAAEEEWENWKPSPALEEGFSKMMKEGYKGHFGLVSNEEGHFCPFPCSFAESDKWLANLVTWLSLCGSRDEILND